MLSVRPLIFRRLYSKSCVAYAESKNFLSVEETRCNLTLKQHDTSQSEMLELNLQLKDLTKAGNLESARILFDNSPHKNEISWTTMIAGYVNVNQSSEALSLFSRMWVTPSIHMDPFILSLAVKACAHNMNASYGELLHCYSVKTDFVYSVFVGSALTDMYMKNGRVFDGCRMFDELPLRNVVTWTAFITGLVRAGFHVHGLMYFAKMWCDGVEYDSYTFAIALKACADMELFNYGREIHTRTIKQGVDVTSYVANTLATMYNKCGRLRHGLLLFESMSTPDVVSWTTMITSCVQIGKEVEGIDLFLQMRKCHICPNEYTYAAVISGVANIGKLNLGKQFHAHMIHLGLTDSLSVANSLMAMYSKCELSDLAAVIFHEMTRKDVISWSTMIAAYAKGGYAEEVFALLSFMKTKGPKPTEYAISSALSICGSMSILDQGRQLHAYVLTIGLDKKSLIQSSLINLYSKCGNIGEAEKIFCMAENDDIVSWTAMIYGYAEHGYSHEAIDLFEKISSVGLRPDSVAFIGVLSACNHVGLLDLGFYYFDLMTKEHGIKPSKEHHGCMIDLLCRAGKLSEAENMIRTMPFEQDDVVWSTLLRASREKGDVARATTAAKEILRLNPSCAGTHITLANTFASKGKWIEAAHIRKLLKSKGLAKEPGWSWIKTMNQITTFMAGDKTHPNCYDIYNILELVASKEELTAQEFDSVLHVT